MQSRPFGASGPRIPVIGQGTWMMERGDRARPIAALRRGIELGLTHIDTAEMYGSGEVESIVGQALRGLRERVFLVSKVLPSNASYAGTLQACERSLKRLSTDAIDCYLLHWPGSHPLEETIRAFDKLQREGKIRSYGVSNFDVEEMERAVGIAGHGRIACNQVLYNLQERTVEHAVLSWCRDRGIALVAYSPLGARGFRSSAQLDAVAERRGASARQVALAYLIRQAGVFVIPKSSVLGHVEENAAAAGITLSDEEIRRIEESFPRGPWRGLATA